MDPGWTDEDYCLEYLKGLRWPGGVPCPRCQAITPHRKLPGRRQYACSRCGKQESVTAGTLMHRTNTLSPWFQAAWLLTRLGERVSIRSVAISLDISLDMALRVCHRIGGVIESLDLETLPVTWASVMDRCISPLPNGQPESIVSVATDSPITQADLLSEAQTQLDAALRAIGNAEAALKRTHLSRTLRPHQDASLLLVTQYRDLVAETAREGDGKVD